MLSLNGSLRLDIYKLGLTASQVVRLDRLKLNFNGCDPAI